MKTVDSGAIRLTSHTRKDLLSLVKKRRRTTLASPHHFLQIKKKKEEKASVILYKKKNLQVYKVRNTYKQ
jgi:hypothetical protein